MLRREIPHPTDQHHPTRQRGREASIEMQTWEEEKKIIVEDFSDKRLVYQKTIVPVLGDKRMVYHNINTKADKAVIRVRLERPPGWHKGHDLDSFHLALQKEQGL